MTTLIALLAMALALFFLLVEDSFYLFIRFGWRTTKLVMLALVVYAVYKVVFVL